MHECMGSAGEEATCVNKQDGAQRAHARDAAACDQPGHAVHHQHLRVDAVISPPSPAAHQTKCWIRACVAALCYAAA